MVPWRDPRHLQIAALAGLLAYGCGWLGFDVAPEIAAVLLGTALAAQWAFDRAHGRRFEPRSALISGLSLCLLFRTHSWPAAVLAAVLAIGSKFVLRARGKHVFNPTNFGIVATVYATRAAWVSAGQWGASAFLGFLVACVGALVVQRALRSDVTFAFLAAHAGVLFGRAAWLGDPIAIPLHQMESGGMLLFAFFMISDPKTTPDARAARVLFGIAVALLAGYFQFALYRPVSLLPALVVLSPLVPILDRALPGRRYSWPGAPADPTPSPEGVEHASLPAARRLDGARVGAPGPAVLRLLRRQGR